MDGFIMDRPGRSLNRGETGPSVPGWRTPGHDRWWGRRQSDLGTSRGHPREIAGNPPLLECLKSRSSSFLSLPFSAARVLTMRHHGERPHRLRVGFALVVERLEDRRLLSG